MGAVDEIIAGLPIDQLAAELGADPDATLAAVREAVPALFGGLQANVADPQGALGLAEALTQHAELDPLDGVDLGSVDVEDGAKIVQHIFGAQPEQIQTLGAGASGSLMKQLLPILAPIVLSYLAKRLGVGSAKSSGSSGGGLGDLLGPILGGVLGGSAGGGSQSQAEPSNGGDIFGQILGQVLGGGAQTTQQSGGASGDILGQILGQVLGGGGSGSAAEAPAPTPSTTTTTSTSGPFQQYPGSPKSGEPQISLDDEPEAAPAQQQDGLGGILGQIFGR